MGTVDIGHEVTARAIVIRGKCKGGHGRAKVGAADADIHHIGEPSAARGCNVAGPDIFAKGLHPSQGCRNFRANVAAIDLQRCGVVGAQGRM